MRTLPPAVRSPRAPHLVACASLVAFLGLCGAAAAAQTAAAAATSRRPFAEAWAAGTPRSVRGEVAIVALDDFAASRFDVRHTLRDEASGRTYEVRFEGEPPADLVSGRFVQLSGRAFGSELLIAGCCTSTSGTGLLAGSSPPTGDQRTLVMLAGFRDAAVSCPADAVRAAMFDDPGGLSVNALYTASSLGTLTFSGQVVGPYVLDASSSDPCNISGWAAAADAAAAASGVDVAAYPRRVYVMPRNTCPGAGLGTVGSVQSSRAWIFDCGTRGVFAHEIGHNLGFDHASTPTQEYGDGTDPMTVASWMLPGVNAPHRHALGWLPEEAAVITASGVYQLTTLAAAPGTAGAPRALLVPKADTNERYYLSYRTPIGFDRYIDAAYHYQLSVHRYRGDGTVARTFLLAGLGDGRTFVDEVNGLAVTLVSHTDTSATVRVEFTSPCVPAAPTIAVTPQSQTAFAGTSVSYAVSITNHDAPACAPRALALSGVYPAGWTGLIEPSTVPVNGGASAQAIVSLTSPVSAGQGTYGATITTADAVTGPVSAVATYVVQSALDSRPPDAPSGLSATVNSRKKQIGLTWQAASDDRGVAGYRILRNGVIVGTSASTAWIDTAWSAGASYQYAVVAYDAAGNVSAPSAGVNVTLSGGGKKR